jgi:hypothetical protein
MPLGPSDKSIVNVSLRDTPKGFVCWFFGFDLHAWDSSGYPAHERCGLSGARNAYLRLRLEAWESYADVKIASLQRGELRPLRNPSDLTEEVA